MKYLVLILCLFLNLHFSLGQEVFKPCVTDERVDGSPKGGRASENGWQLPTEGELSILIIFAEVEYILIDDDPEPTGTTDWPVGDLPSFKDNIVDPVFPSLGNFQGDLTRFYAEASLNELELTGDYLVSPTNNGVFRVQEIDVNSLGLRRAVIQKVNAELSSFQTNSSLPQSTFDNTDNSIPYGANGLANNEYDCVVFIYRNVDGYGNSGNAQSGGWSELLLGWSADTGLQVGPGLSNEGPTMVLKHEFGHLLFGNNSLHTCGGGDQRNYWIPNTSGHAIMGLNFQSIQSWSAWDQFWCGWKGSNNFIISARNTSGTEINGDLDATDPTDEGIYVLRDFVETGDAVRIKLPFLDPINEHEQFIWIENHQGQLQNTNPFDKFFYRGNNVCITDVPAGLVCYRQIDRNTLSGSSSSFSVGDSQYLRQMNASGDFDRVLFTPIQNTCTNPEFYHPIEADIENPLTGFCDTDRYPFDLDGDGNLDYTDDEFNHIKREAGVNIFEVFSHGHSSHIFRPNINDRIGIGTNPSSANKMNLSSLGTVTNPNVGKNIRSVYLNGVEIKLLEQLTNGDVRVEIKFDKVDVDQDVRWCGPSIILNEINQAPAYSLVLNSGNTIHLDQGLSATQMDGTINVEGQDVFTETTHFVAKNDAYINLESNSELIIDRKSKLTLEAGSRIDVQNGAVIRLKREGALELLGNSVLNLEPGAKLIIEDGFGSYSKGKLIFHENARINLESSTSIIEVEGLIEIGDDAVFKLSNSSSADKTHGKIHFKSNADTEIIAGTNAEIYFEGYGSTNEVVINENVVFEFPSNLVRFTFKDLRLSQGFADRIVPPKSNACISLFDNVLVTNKSGTFDSYGVSTYGQKSLIFTGCKFSNLWRGIYSDNTSLGNILYVENSHFEDCKYGINTYGKGATLKKLTFEDCEWPWIALNTSSTSLFDECQTVGTINENVSYTGASNLFVRECTIKDGTIGVYVEQASAYISCSSIKDQSQYAISQDMGASLTMDAAYGANDLRGNPRTIDIFNGNILDLDGGENDLRSAVNGSVNVVNGNLLCPGASSLSARSNKWNSAGTAPTSSDYSLARSCLPPFPVTLIDTSPLNLAFSIECFQTIPGELKSNGEDFAELPGFNNEVTDTLLYSEFLDIISQLNSTQINTSTFFPVVEGVQLEGAENWMNPNEYAQIELGGFNALSEMLNSAPDFIESLGYTNYSKAINELFNSFLELYTLNQNDIITDSNLGQAQGDMLAHLDGALNEFDQIEANSRVFHGHLIKAQYFRILGSYDLAFEELATAMQFVQTDEESELVSRLNCMLVHEYNSVEYGDEFDFMNFTNDCDPAGINTGEENQSNQSIQAKLNVAPNPAVSFTRLELVNNDFASEISRVEIFDLGGRRMMEIPNYNMTQLDLGELDRGVYLIKVTTNNGEVFTSMLYKN